MLSLLSAAGRAFLRAFLAAIIVFAPGILAAPNLNQMYLLGVAAVIAAISAGVRAVQAYVPEISLVHYLGHPYGDWLDSFLRAGVSTFLVLLIGVMNAPDLATGRSLLTAAIVGAFAAGIRAVQGALTASERPSASTGLSEPEMPYSYGHPGG